MGGGGGVVGETVHDAGEVGLLKVRGVEAGVVAGVDAESSESVQCVGLLDGGEGGADVGARGRGVTGDVGSRCGSPLRILRGEVLGGGDLIREGARAAHPGPVVVDIGAAKVAMPFSRNSGGRGEFVMERTGKVSVVGEGTLGLEPGSGLSVVGERRLRGCGVSRLGLCHLEMVTEGGNCR